MVISLVNMSTKILKKDIFFIQHSMFNIDAILK